jgi:hypothetical protein
MSESNSTSIKTYTSSSPLALDPLLTEEQAAEHLGFAKETLRVWRSKSRRAKRLIGPKWVELGGEGRARCIRYRIGDVAWEPPKKRGRPRSSTSGQSEWQP